MAGDRLHASDAGGELLASPAQHRFSHLLYALWHFLRDYFCGDFFFSSPGVFMMMETLLILFQFRG